MADVNANLPALAAAEHDNLHKSRQALETIWNAAEPIPLLYGTLSQSLWNREDVAKRPEVYGLSTFLLAAQRAASVGILTIGRLHLQESVYLERRCLELVGFCYRSWKDPSALTKWLHAGRDSAAYEEYQREFSGKRLRGDLQELGGKLLGAYDRSNKMIHSSLYSLAQSYEHATVAGGTELRIHMFDAQENDHWPRVALELLRVLDVHLDATARLAAVILSGRAARFARLHWRRAHDPAISDLRVEKERWSTRIAGYHGSLRQRTRKRR